MPERVVGFSTGIDRGREKLQRTQKLTPTRLDQRRDTGAGLMEEKRVGASNFPTGLGPVAYLHQLRLSGTMGRN